MTHKTIEHLIVQPEHSMSWLDRAIMASDSEWVAVTDCLNTVPERWGEDLLLAAPNDGVVVCPSFTLVSAASRSAAVPSSLDLLPPSGDMPVMSLKWIPGHGARHHHPPSVMGCCFAVSRRWYGYVGGCRGMMTWDGFQIMLSLKTWLACSQCTVSNLAVERRVDSDMARPDDPSESVLDRLRVAYVVLPHDFRQAVMNKCTGAAGDRAVLMSIREMKSITEDMSAFARVASPDPWEVLKRIGVKAGLKHK